MCYKLFCQINYSLKYKLLIIQTPARIIKANPAR